MEKKKMIMEVYKGPDKPRISESQENVPKGCMRVEGVLGVVNTKNRNNRVYSSDMYSQHINKLKGVIKENGGVLGEMEHPSSMNIDLNNVSHKLEDIWLDENSNNIMGKLLLMNTPKGNIAQSIIESGTTLPISSRGVGSVDESGNVNLEYLCTYDLVGTPGFEQASLHRVSESLNESGKVVSESYEFELNSRGYIAESNDSKNITEEKINNLIDNRIKNIKLPKATTNEQVVDVDAIKSDVIKHVIENIVPDLEDNLSSDNGVNESQVENIFHKQFVSVYSPIIQSWVTEEFAPEVQSWVTEEFAPEVQNWTINEFAPEIQNWTINEFAPEVQSWVTEEFAPEVQNWTINEFAPEIQSWVTEELSPEIQNWTINEFAPEIQSWMFEELNITGKSEPKKLKDITENINDIDLLIKGAKVLSKVKSIDSEESAALIESRRLNENFRTGPSWLVGIPEKYKKVWLQLSESVKNQISRRASVRILNNKKSIDEFWSGVDFGKITESITSNKLISEGAILETKDISSVSSSISDFTKKLR